METPLNYQKMDMVVAGAGAAGLFCALEAAKARSVALIDSGPAPGRKLAISGGGRANFSNRNMQPERYLCHAGSSFCVPALKAFTVDDFLRRMENWGLPWEERTHGRLFLKCPAEQIVNSLAARCAALGCKFYMNEKIKSIKPAQGAFSIFTTRRKIMAKTVVLALGSPARPALGATASGWRLAKSLGHTPLPARAALAPFIFGAKFPPNLRELAGISCRAGIRLPEQGRNLEADEMIFTHTGLSGPAILQASLYWNEGESIAINFLPGQNFEELLDSAPKSTPEAVLRRLLPDRLSCALLPEDIARRKNAELSRNMRRLAGSAVNNMICVDLRLAGLDKAEACSGGVAADEVNGATMQSKIWPNLHIIGEMLDVTGQLGGYNLHWAFASAFCAARHASKG